MRIFHIHSSGVHELTALPHHLPEQGFVWIACARPAFQLRLAEIQQHLQLLTGLQLVDLHVSDLLNPQLPSHYDYTSQYDLLVFRRLGTGNGDSNAGPADVLPGPAAAAAQPAAPAPGKTPPRRGGPPVLRRIDTSPVGFAVFDRVLLTVHPPDCLVRDTYATRLLAAVPSIPHGDVREGRPSPVAGSRLPTSPADLMLRMVNHMVDSYLELRRLLTRQLTTLQRVLLDQNSEFNDWPLLLESRDALHRLEDTCEDQRSAIQEWIDALDEWPATDDPQLHRERELLRVRSRDVLEHVERVLSHVRRLESSAESAVQMHFSALGHRTNSIMRTLTVLTAIFLPLNLITGIFGMNFDWMPLIHMAGGFWDAALLMLAVALGLWFFFRRKRYLGTSR